MADQDRCIKRFTLGQRVEWQRFLLGGMLGTVVRLRRCDDGAWINLDAAAPEEYRRFPADDPSGRANHVLLYPDECLRVD